MGKMILPNWELGERICDFAGAQPKTVLETKIRCHLEMIRNGAAENDPISLTDAARLAVKVFERMEKTTIKRA